MIRKTPYREIGVTVLDIVILAVIAACAIYGARQGLIREMSHIVAFVLGIFLAAKLHGTAARLLLYRLGPNTASIAAFLGLLLLVLAAVYVAFSYLKSAADRLKLGPADHVAGAVVGALQGSLVCALIIFTLINFSSTIPAAYLQRSRVASFLLDRSEKAAEMIPESYFSKLKSLFKSEMAPVSDGIEKEAEKLRPVEYPYPLPHAPRSTGPGTLPLPELPLSSPPAPGTD